MKRRRKPLGLLVDGCLRRAHVPAFGLEHLRHRPLGRLARAVRGAVLGERRRVRTARIERLHEPQRKRTRGLDLHDSLTRAQKRGHGGARSEQVSVGDALIERDAQIPRHVGRRQGRRGVGDALAPYEHRGRKGCVTRDELVDLGGNLLAARRARLGRRNRIGQGEAGACVLVRHAAQVGARRRIGAPHAALVHDTLELLLDLDEHEPVVGQRAVAAQAQLLFVERLVERAFYKGALGRVEVEAAHGRAAVRVRLHVPFERTTHRLGLAGVQAVLDFLPLEHIGECSHLGFLSFKHADHPSRPR